MGFFNVGLFFSVSFFGLSPHGSGPSLEVWAKLTTLNASPCNLWHMKLGHPSNNILKLIFF